MIEFVGLAAAAGRCVASLWRAAIERRALNALLQMDDRLLRDIGLTRADVVDSFTKRMGPFDLLMARRDERRAARSHFQLTRRANHAAAQSNEPPASLAA